jgi:Uma2 family endonuclease
MTATQLRSWTVEEYHGMIAAGILSPDDRVELLQGQIVQMSPQEPHHAAATRRASKYCDRCLGEVADVRAQLPVTLGPNSEPEPDIAIVRLDPQDYATAHPQAADVFLLIEVADSTLAKDRREKTQIYETAGIADYWILDVKHRQVLVFREPHAGGYGVTQVLTVLDAIAPLAFPEQVIQCSDLLLP